MKETSADVAFDVHQKFQRMRWRQYHTGKLTPEFCNRLEVAEKDHKAKGKGNAHLLYNSVEARLHTYAAVISVNCCNKPALCTTGTAYRTTSAPVDRETF